jgi:hypothetical protein
MTRALFHVLALLAWLAGGSAMLWAQELPPSKEELTLRPGDSIRWAPSAAHQVQFGGGTINGKPMTPFATVQAILELPPSLKADGDGIALVDQGQPLSAKVKADAQVGATFNFTCGIHNEMIALPFTIAAAVPGQTQNVLIVTAEGPRRWVLKIDRRLSPP